MEEAKYAAQEKVNSIFRVNFSNCQKQRLLGEWTNKCNVPGYCEGSEQCLSSLYWGNHRHDQVWRNMALNEYLEEMINWVYHFGIIHILTLIQEPRWSSCHCPQRTWTKSAEIGESNRGLKHMNRFVTNIGLKHMNRLVTKKGLKTMIRLARTKGWKTLCIWYLSTHSLLCTTPCTRRKPWKVERSGSYPIYHIIHKIILYIICMKVLVLPDIPGEKRIAYTIHEYPLSSHQW